ncbi:hypothetical protein BGZ79_006461, partial [Entomortierella chlamydospora]
MAPTFNHNCTIPSYTNNTMSAPAAVNPVRNVARWSALAFGLVYGYVHHNSLVALEHNRADQIKAENRERLIAQAKAEWSKKNTSAG